MGETEGTYRALQTPGTRLGAQIPAGVSTLEPGQTPTLAAAVRTPARLHIRVQLLDDTMEVFDVELREEVPCSTSGSRFSLGPTCTCSPGRDDVRACLPLLGPPGSDLFVASAGLHTLGIVLTRISVLLSRGLCLQGGLLQLTQHGTQPLMCSVVSFTYVCTMPSRSGQSTTLTRTLVPLVPFVPEDFVRSFLSGPQCATYDLDAAEITAVTLHLSLRPRCGGQALLTHVWRRLSLIECDYFGLEFQSTQAHWVGAVGLFLGAGVGCSGSRRSHGAETSEALLQPCHRYLFALQLKRDLLEERLTCTDSTAALLTSHLLQCERLPRGRAEIGDYDEELDRAHLRAHEYLPGQERALEKILALHREHAGQTPAESDFQVLEIARKLEMYGIRFHTASDREGAQIKLAVSHTGVLVFQSTTKINTFNWSRLRKLSFKRKRFLVKLHPEAHGPYQDTLEFLLGSRDECKNFWKICVEHHTFFRLSDQPKPKARAVLFSRGSSFRYRRHSKTRVSLHTLTADLPRQSISFPEGMRTPASPSATNASSCSVPASPPAPPGPLHCQDRGGSLPPPPAPDAKRPATERSSSPDASQAQPPRPPALQPCQGVGSCRVVRSCSASSPAGRDLGALDLDAGGAGRERQAAGRSDRGEGGMTVCSSSSGGGSPHGWQSSRGTPIFTLTSTRLQVSEEFIDDDPADISFFAGGSEAFSFPYGSLAPQAPLCSPPGSGLSSPDRSSPEAARRSTELSFEFGREGSPGGDVRPAGASELLEVKAQASLMQRLLSPSETSSLSNAPLHGGLSVHTPSSASQSEASSMANFPACSVRSEASSAFQFSDIIDQLEQVSYPPTTAEASSSSDTDSWGSEPETPPDPCAAVAAVAPALVLHACLLCALGGGRTPVTGICNCDKRGNTQKRKRTVLTESSCPAAASPWPVTLLVKVSFSDSGVAFWNSLSVGSDQGPFQQQAQRGPGSGAARVGASAGVTLLLRVGALCRVVPGLCDTRTCPPEDEAYFIAKEILTTEQTYLKDLEVITVWFRSTLVQEDAMPAELMHLLFSSVDPIYDFHKGFLHEVEQRLALWEASASAPGGRGRCRIGDILRRNMLQLKVCLVSPPVRAPRTPCQDALQAVTEVTSELQHSLVRLENLQKLTELQRDLVGIENLVAPDRFSDVLLYTSRGASGTSRFRMRGLLPLRGMLVEERQNEWPAPHCFTIYAAQKTVVVAASTQLEKEKWMQDLQAAIDAAKHSSGTALGLPGSMVCALSRSPISSEQRLSSPRGSPDEVSLEQESEDARGAGGPLEGQGRHRANTTVHVCWHRSTSVSRADRSAAVENQLSGYLLRKFKNSSGWQKLWVVLTNFCLFFYKTHQDDYPLASLPLLGYQVSIPREADGIHKEHVFKLQFKSHIYFFRAESKYTFRRWMEVIEKASSCPGRARPPEEEA
ncbi:FERM, RhoGEF and pleckstrin domain-containing protein 2 [Camelus ferus]|nr:FERM, RhoGEF and pleckstrin domain-containing protein 2 [Camelus ferus]